MDCRVPRTDMHSYHCHTFLLLRYLCKLLRLDAVHPGVYRNRNCPVSTALDQPVQKESCLHETHHLASMQLHSLGSRCLPTDQDEPLSMVQVVAASIWTNGGGPARDRYNRTVPLGIHPLLGAAVCQKHGSQRH